MLPLMLSLLAEVCSSLPASLPAKPAFSCASADTGCWKRAALDLDDALNTTRDLLVLERAKTTELGQQVVAMTAAYENAQKTAERFAEQALKNSERPWHQSPALWASVASLATAALAIGISHSLKIQVVAR